MLRQKQNKRGDITSPRDVFLIVAVQNWFGWCFMRQQQACCFDGSIAKCLREDKAIYKELEQVFFIEHSIIQSFNLHRIACFLFPSSLFLPRSSRSRFWHKRLSMKNLWLISIKETCEISSDGNRKTDRRIRPGGDSQGNQKDPSHPGEQPVPDGINADGAILPCFDGYRGQM